MGFCTERFGRRAALIVGAASAFATTLWVYARYPYSELLQALDSGTLDVRGDKPLFRQFVQTLDSFNPMFNVVEP